jgi:hypothetical protein
LEGWLEAGEGLHAPAVLPYEVANVLGRLVFDGALEINEVKDIWDDLAAVDLVLHPYPVDSHPPTDDGHARRGRRKEIPCNVSAYSGVLISDG